MEIEKMYEFVKLEKWIPIKVAMNVGVNLCVFNRYLLQLTNKNQKKEQLFYPDNVDVKSRKMTDFEDWYEKNKDELKLAYDELIKLSSEYGIELVDSTNTYAEFIRMMFQESD
jgi:hypothetical protein